MNKFILRSTLLSLSTALLLGITGCSSGSSSDDPVTQAASKAYNGIGIDGILVGSTVCVDGNPTNNKCDAGEPSAITDEKGQFSIPATTVTGPLLLVGGIDNSTGAAFTGSLKAPAGSTVVTPLTSAIQSLVEGGKSAQDAEANVKAAMGLSGLTDVNLTSFDPYNEVSANAQAVLAKQTQLQVLVHSATVTVAGADDSTDVNSTMSSVFDAIVGSFKGATAEVELDAATVSAATKAAADTVYADNQAARVAAKVVAQTSAENSVRDADNAEGAISDGTPAQAAGNLDSAIAKANTTAEVELRAAAQAAKIKSQELLDANADALDEIEALQKAQQEKEAEIAAAKAAQAKAEADLATAKAAAEADTADRVKYEAFLAAQAEAEKAAKDKALADLAVAQAQIAAAQAEASIAAEAAERQATAEAAEAQAQAEADAAQLRQDAADAAALAAADQEKTLAEAQAAVLVAQQTASLGIAQAQVNTNVQVANFFAMQATQDANATRTLANLAVTGTLADANAAAAESARDAALQAASDANVTIVAIDDINASLVTSLGHKNEAQAQAVLAAAALGDAYKVKADAELAAAAQVALQVKIERIAAIVADVNGTKNTAQTLYDVNTTEIGNSISSAMTAIGTIASLYSDAQVKFTDANASAQIVLKAYTDAGASIVLVQQAYSDASSALSDVNETAATQAKDVADAEKAKLDAYLAIGYAQVDVIEGLLKEAQAIKTAVDNTPVVVPTGDKFVDGFKFGNFDIDNDGVYASTIELSGGTVLVAVSKLTDGSFVPVTNLDSDDYELIDGVWTKETNGGTYTLESDGSVTLANGSSIKVAAAIDLTDASSTQAQAILSEVNKNVPGDDVAFSANAKAYLFAEKAVTGYSLYWTPDDYDNANAKFTTLLSFMQSNSNVAGVMDTNGTWHGVHFQKSDNNAVINSAGEVITSLVSGMNGNLERVFELDVVGTWSVVTLPVSGELAIILEATDESAFENDYNNLVAVNTGATNAPVMVGDFTPKSDVYVTDSDEVQFNEVAFDDIKAAVEAGVSTFSLDSYIRGNTLYYINQDGTAALYNYAQDGTLTGVDSNGAYGEDGTETYTISGDTYTVVNTTVGEECTCTFTHSGTTPDGKGQMFEVYLNGTNMFEAVLYANELDRDAEMGISPTATQFTLPTLNGMTVYEVELQRGSDTIHDMAFSASEFTINGVNGSETLGYTQNENNLTIIVGGNPVGVMSFYSPEVNATYIATVTEDNGNTNYYFLDRTVAQTFVDANAADIPADSDSFLVNFFVGKTVYGIQLHENDGTAYGTSMTLDYGSTNENPVYAGLLGGNDEWGDYGIVGSNPESDHSYIIGGDELYIFEESDAQNEESLAVLTYIGTSPNGLGEKFEVRFFNTLGVKTGTYTGNLYLSAESRDTAILQGVTE